MIAHLRGPVKGVSSFDKICSHLIHSQDFSDYIDKVFKILDASNVAGWTFAPGGDDCNDDPAKKKNVAPPRWNLQIDWGKKADGSDNIELVTGNVREWMVSMYKICDEDAMSEIVDKNFGKANCPTYNCKKDKLLGKDGAKGATNHWARAVREALNEKLMDKIARTQEKIRVAMVSALDSEAFEKEMTSYHERCIADEIKKVLLKFSSVAKPHVIKMAMDEFVCHEIMES